jgi:hypothetical protein
VLSSKSACEIARALPNVSEKDHFGSDAFYANKRIFATVWHNKNQVNVRLTPSQQKTFLETDGEALIEIENAWGKQGWTTVQLDFVDRKLFTEVVKAAWESSAMKMPKASGNKTKANKVKGAAKSKKAVNSNGRT